MCRKYIIRSIVIMTIIISVIGTWYYTNKREQIVLEFGMFTGSNWGVENANSFLIIDRAIARFEKKHPNVKVKYTSGIDKKDYSEWCAKKLLSGNLPDVFMVLDTDFNLYYKLGVLQELDSYMEQDLEFNKEDFFKTALDIGKGIGEEKVQYALPYEVVPTLLFVNKTLLKQENIDIPDKEWTWEEFYNICKKVTKDTDQDGRVDQFGTYNYTWLDAMYTSGGSLFEDENEKINFSSKYMIESLKFMKKLNDLNKGEKVTQEDFDAGKVAFMPLTFAEYRTYKTYPYRIKKYTNFQWDCITFPARIKGNNTSKVDALLIGINHYTKQKKLAWELLKELTYTKESQMDIFQYSQGSSALKEVSGAKEIEAMIQGEMDKKESVISTDLLCEIISGGTIIPKPYKYEQYEQIMSLADTEITKIFEQNKNIESNMKIFQRQINQYLNK